MAHDAVVRTAGEVVHIAAHRLVVVGDEGAVAIHVIVHEGENHQGGAPFGGVIKEIAERHILGCGGRHHAIGLLGVHYVADNLGHQGGHVVVVEERRTHKVILLQPTQFLAVRTVGEHGLHVASFGALYQPVGLRHQLVVAPEGGGLGGGVVNEATLQVVDDRQTIGIGLLFHHGSLYLDVAETIVGEPGMPCLLSVTFQSVLVIMLATRLALVAHALWGEAFRDEHRHLLPTLARDGDGGESGEVLPHVADEGGCVYLTLALARGRFERVLVDRAHRLDGETLHDAHRRGGLGIQLSLRTFHHHGFFPLAVVEFGFKTSLLLQSGIIRLTAIDAVERDGTLAPMPTVIAHHMLSGTVVVSDVHPQEQLRWTETGLQLAVAVAALYIEEAVAQQHCHGIVALAQELGHVVGVVVHRTAVFAP